jgi:hypothetical protein
MKIFSYKKYHKDDGREAYWAKIVDGREVIKDSKNGRLYVTDSIQRIEVLPEWCIDVELSDSERYTVKKEVRKVVSLIYEAWDRLSGLNHTIDAVDFKEEDTLDEIVYDLNKYLKEEL